MKIQIYHHNGQLAEYHLDDVTGFQITAETGLEELTPAAVAINANIADLLKPPAAPVEAAPGDPRGPTGPAGTGGITVTDTSEGGIVLSATVDTPAEVVTDVEPVDTPEPAVEKDDA